MTTVQASVAMGLLDRVLPKLTTTTLEGSAEHPLQARLTVAWEAVDVRPRELGAADTKQIEHKRESD